MIKNYFLFLIAFLGLASNAYSQNPRTTVTITEKNLSVVSYTDKEVVLNNQTDLHLTAAATQTKAVLNNSIIKLNSDNSWVFFDNIRPQFVIDSLLKCIYVNNQAAVLKTNVRVSLYKHGAVVIPQSSSFQPLKVYTGQNFTGDSASYSMFTYYNSLGTKDNKIRSIKLKRGYMVTVATGSDGLGYSRVYIADDNDLEIAIMPALLDNSISFIRVFNWEYVNKKGWCGTSPGTLSKLNATWCYDWSAYAATNAAGEYVPMHAKLTWAPFAQINGLQNVTHSLGFNEPDHPEQHKDDNGGKALTVSQALAQWPDYLKSGLRVGAPACTDFSWLYQFMDSCKAKNYRVDYVAVHAYWGGKSPANWYNDLKYIYTKTGRPIWITEWNNGANWTTETWPTADRSLSTANAAKQLADIKAILNVLDTASFIERYAIYDWVQDCRAMILADTLTPAGKYYSSTKPPMAFKRKYEVTPTFTYSNPTLAITFPTTTKLALKITDPNAESLRGFILEKKVDNGAYTEFYRSVNSTLIDYSDTLNLNAANKIRYRVRSVLADGTITGYSNEVGYNVSGGAEDATNGNNFQYGTVGLSNIGWNQVFFKSAYTGIPSIILGAPTNANSSVQLSARAKYYSLTRFNLQIIPWAYQKVTSLAKEESIPYFISNIGNYDLGTLKAKAGKAPVTSAWTPVVFSAPFDTVPVVFATQLSPATTFATTVRVRNVTKTGFEAKLQKETAVTNTLSSETVSYFAITPGTGTIDNKKVIVGKTADKAVSTIYSTIYYGDSIPNPVFISQMQTCNDDTVTATIRCLTVSSKYANVVKQRERSTGVTTTAAEMAGWMVINPVSTIQAVNAPSADVVTFFPNPVKDVLHLTQNTFDSSVVEIYNMMGALVKQIRVSENEINVSDLLPGCYVLKTKQNGSRVFVKL
ncbi:MAG: glycosyl hydrolase [Paludibacter sp.]